MEFRRGLRFSGEVRDLASDGSGVVRHPSGHIVFVPGLWRGEQALIEVRELRGSVGLGRMLELERADPGRTQPACPHHGFGAGECGGCPWMFMNYSEQVAAKGERVRQALERLGAGQGVLQEVRAAQDPLGYRRRAQLKTDGTRIGFLSSGSRALASIDDCLVLTDPLRRLLDQMRASLPREDWRPARRRGFSTLDIDEASTLDSVRVNRRLPFAQAHAGQNRFMQDWLAERIKGSSDAAALELFCGDGNFTRVVAAAGFASVLAVDVNEEAIGGLRQSALDGVEALASDLFEETAVTALALRARAARFLLLDPPRDGFRLMGSLLDGLGSLQAVCYVSCDLATWQRDAAVLLDHGFALETVQPVDQFPQTPHLEILSWFRAG